MKKLSFLELEKEMEVMTEEENFRTKAGGGGPGDPTDCMFQSLAAVLEYQGITKSNGIGFTSAGLENRFYSNHPNADDITVAGGSIFAHNVLGDDDMRRLELGCVTYSTAKEFITELRSQGHSFIVSYGNENTDGYHAVVIKGFGSNGKINVFDKQAKENGSGTGYYSIDYTEIAHNYLIDIKKGGVNTEIPTTTIPTTTIPTTTLPTTTF